eukprot:CAMPEP_0197653528 /NCGR_PEP_ID=MMETSP1338-20131121/35916_1 /TAXON_ID=43686 ORGANISM="Pelagodinium beii, Strain RCC1491" /NCGR_SAMPLE_ID=MMETSP1338 /ASSEMBLY_ACC=CAM_ASM_000754 /LENGTH=141 /DNA_ID=CAMNT_0043228671 /DNA_START=128 /DNA_END=553 /DNA_ORIENTATION=+
MENSEQLSAAKVGPPDGTEPGTYENGASDWVVPGYEQPWLDRCCLCANEDRPGEKTSCKEFPKKCALVAAIVPFGQSGFMRGSCINHCRAAGMREVDIGDHDGPCSTGEGDALSKKYNTILGVKTMGTGGRNVKAGLKMLG